MKYHIKKNKKKQNTSKPAFELEQTFVANSQCLALDTLCYEQNWVGTQ